MLDIKLASKKTNVGRVAFAGFPYTQLDKYLKLLVHELNKNVAISEEYPIPTSRKVTSGGLLFDRMVKRVVTPGTLIDESFLDPLRNNYLLALHAEKPFQLLTNDLQKHVDSPDVTTVGMAWMDLSTGQFFVDSTTVETLPTSLARINPREVLLTPTLDELIGDKLLHIIPDIRRTLAPPTRGEVEFSISEWTSIFENEAGVSEQDFPSNPTELAAIQQILNYARSMLDTGNLRLQTPIRPKTADFMGIDRSSLRGLEILETSRDGLHQGSLLHAVRRTVTKGGARLLRERLVSPSASLSEIEDRQNLLSAFLSNELLRQEMTVSLRKTYDTVRLVQKIVFNRGEPDDLVCLARAIEASQEIVLALRQVVEPTSTIETASNLSLQSLVERIVLDGPLRFAESVFHAIDEDGLSQRHRLEEEAEFDAIESGKRVVLSEGSAEDMEALGLKSRRNKASSSKEQPLPYEDTWIMRRTASAALRQLHNELDKFQEQKIELTQELRKTLNSPSLSLKWTPGLGYFAHVKGGDKASFDRIHARTVSSSKSTRSVVLEEWSRLGADMDQIRAHIRDEEQRVLFKLRDKVLANLVRLRRNAVVMDEIDVACSFATLAQENHLVRPVMTDSMVHKIYGGRHPTVELGLAKTGRQFVRNDCHISPDERIWLVTGPNMAGKSTFLRQNALITILAQVGSYVPADYAEIGIVDKIFSRVGAADDLFRDQSTFMVEMLETAEILKQATPKSFVIMDEVGRGTSPSDGTAVAFACLHHLYHVNKCRTLFATHFHTLADMTSDFEQLACYCSRVDAEDGSFSFVHRLEKGVNRQSHALDVARLAGLPELALQVAADTLTHMHGKREDLNNSDFDRPTTRRISATA